jgi:type II secretory pathway pseudopilin PulG
MKQAAHTYRSNAGFTLAEILAAMVFMAIVLPVAFEGMSIATRGSVASQRAREAAQLGDALLTELVATGDWQDGNQDGDFEPDHNGYSWRLTTQDWSEDVMRLLTLEVTFKVQGHDYSVRLSTLVPEAEQE